MCLLFHIAEFCGVLSTKISTVIREVCLEVCVSALDLNLSLNLRLNSSPGLDEAELLINRGRHTHLVTVPRGPRVPGLVYFIHQAWTKGEAPQRGLRSCGPEYEIRLITDN